MDTITYDFLENGDVKIQTDKVSAPNHANADALIKSVVEALGGKSTVSKKAPKETKHHHETVDNKQ